MKKNSEFMISNLITQLKTETRLSHILNIMEKLGNVKEVDPIHIENIDYSIKSILRQYKSSEIIEKLSNLLWMIHDPKCLYDELMVYLEIDEMKIPTIMLIYLLQNKTDFYFDNFEYKLVECITVETIASEGFLFFILQVIQDSIAGNKSQLNTLIIVNKLIELTITEVKSSKNAVKILYVILVALRMNPELFVVANINKLHILSKSFNTIQRLVNQIYIEAKNPTKRPRTVFLKNFIFPSL